MYIDILEKYNALPSNKQNDIKSFVIKFMKANKRKN